MSIQGKDEPMEEEAPITLGQPLSDFLLQLEDYTPTVSSPDLVTTLIVNLAVTPGSFKLDNFPQCFSAEFKTCFLDPRCCNRPLHTLLRV